MFDIPSLAMIFAVFVITLLDVFVVLYSVLYQLHAHTAGFLCVDMCMCVYMCVHPQGYNN